MSTGTAIALSVGAISVIFLLTLVLVGLSVEALARFLLPGPDPMSLPATAGYGIAGSLVGACSAGSAPGVSRATCFRWAARCC